MSRPANDVRFREPLPCDIAATASRMRAADQAECRAGGLDDMLHAVDSSVACSSWARAALLGDDLLGIFGVSPIGTVLTPFGAPWALGTDSVLRHPRAFVRWTRTMLGEMLSMYPVLMNYVHADNAFAVRWLGRVGFRIYAAVPYGPRGALFHRFEMRA